MHRLFNLPPRQYFQLLDIKETAETYTYVFAKPNNFNYGPGQYLSLFPTKMGPRQLMQSVTLLFSSGTNDETIEVTFAKANHLISTKGLLQHYQIGQLVMINGPYGDAFKINDQPILLIGAGSGISLIRSVLHSVTPTQTNIACIYSAKMKKNIPDFDEVDTWAAQPQNYFTLTAENEAVPNNWHTGRMSEHLVQRKIDPNTKILICGPDAFIKDVCLTLQKTQDHPIENIFISSNWIKSGETNIYSLADEQAIALLHKENCFVEKKKNMM